jgi:pyruvate dehydrogenase E1 component beta subunit
VTLITYSRSLRATLAAAEKLAEDGIEAEVIDLRSIRPLDIDTLVNSVVKTHRAVIVEEDWPYCGLGAGIADRINQRAFDELDAPIRRVAAKDAPIPYNRALEASMLPNVERIVADVRDVLYR